MRTVYLYKHKTVDTTAENSPKSVKEEISLNVVIFSIMNLRKVIEPVKKYIKSAKVVLNKPYTKVLH